MALFKFKSMAKTGQIVRGRLEDVNKTNVIKRLKANKLIPITVTKINTPSPKKNQRKRMMMSQTMLLKNSQSNTSSKKKKNIMITFFKQNKVKNDDIVSFTQSLYLLKKANFNNIQALSSLIDSIENEYLKEIVEDILSGVESGETIFSIMEYYPDVFPYVYINIIKVGELSGSLTNALFQAVVYLQQRFKLNKQLKKILVPNILQFVGITILLFAGLLWGIPQVENVYKMFGSKKDIGKSAKIASEIAKGIVHYWWAIVLFFGTLSAAIISYINTPSGKYKFDMMILKSPIFGKLIVLINISKFFEAVMLNLKNGVRIQEAIEVSKYVVNNYVILSLIESSKNNLLIGESWIKPFEDSGLFPSMVTEMLKIGMQTDVSEMMGKIIEYVEYDVQNTLDSIVKVLPEVTYGIVGVVILIFTLTVMVPLMNVYMGTFLM